MLKSGKADCPLFVPTESPIPDSNLIRFHRIHAGQEKRTSCILRNLPNRMTQLELMEVSQLVSPLKSNPILTFEVFLVC